MHILILALQVLLGLWSITGGTYLISHYTALGTDWAVGVLPAFVWVLLGTIETIGGTVLVVAAVMRRIRRFVTPVAFTLAGTSLLGLVLFSTYQGFLGVLWGIIPAILYWLIGRHYCSRQ